MFNNGKSFFDEIVTSPGYAKFKAFMLKACAVVIGAAVIFKYVAHNEMGTMLLTVGMGTLAVIFFMMAFERPQGWHEVTFDDGEAPQNVDFWSSNAMILFTQKLWGWGLSILTIGLLFTLCHWPGVNVMLISGLGTFAIALAFKLLTKR